MCKKLTTRLHSWVCLLYDWLEQWPRKATGLPNDGVGYGADAADFCWSSSAHRGLNRRNWRLRLHWAHSPHPSSAWQTWPHAVDVHSRNFAKLNLHFRRLHLLHLIRYCRRRRQRLAFQWSSYGLAQQLVARQANWPMTVNRVTMEEKPKQMDVAERAALEAWANARQPIPFQFQKNGHQYDLLISLPILL